MMAGYNYKGGLDYIGFALQRWIYSTVVVGICLNHRLQYNYAIRYILSNPN